MHELQRPRPSLPAPALFWPDEQLSLWARATFIEDGGPLYNPEHEHLQFASIGFLWTVAPNSRRGRTVLGQVEKLPPTVTAGKWLKARIEMQLLDWFEDMPDFLITLDAGYAEECTDVEFCALVEHELLHCGQEHDEFGAPKFNKQTGLPKFGIRGHDVEEFTSVVRRYGVTDDATAELVAAANATPEVGRAQMARACGTCLKVA